MDSQVIYFKSIKSKSVAIMGANSKAIFYNDKAVGISDPDDIYIYRKKDTLLIETDIDGTPINIEPGMVLGRDGIRKRPAPLSHTTYHGFEGAKRRQIRAEEDLNREQANKNNNDEDTGKSDLDDELSAEDDLSVDSDDFNFEDKDGKTEKKKSKKKKAVKESSKKKSVKKKKTSDKKKVKVKSSKNKSKKKKLDELREFRS